MADHRQFLCFAARHAVISFFFFLEIPSPPSFSSLILLFSFSSTSRKKFVSKAVNHFRFFFGLPLILLHFLTTLLSFHIPITSKWLVVSCRALSTRLPRPVRRKRREAIEPGHEGRRLRRLVFWTSQSMRTLKRLLFGVWDFISSRTASRRSASFSLATC